MNEHTAWMLTYEHMARQYVKEQTTYDLPPYLWHDIDWVDRLYIDYESLGGD